MSARNHTPSPTVGARLAELLMSAAAELADAPRSGLVPMGIPARDGRFTLGRRRELLPRDETLELVVGFDVACWIGPPWLRSPNLGRLTHRGRTRLDRRGRVQLDYRTRAWLVVHSAFGDVY